MLYFQQNCCQDLITISLCLDVFIQPKGIDLNSSANW
jgi:hypothetical protein